MVPRELREKDEIEKYRMERPKIQQQFSDLKVRHCVLMATESTLLYCLRAVLPFKSAKDTFSVS